MSAGYDGRTIVWDVSFKLLHTIGSIFGPSLFIDVFSYSFGCRYGKAHQFGYMKLLVSSWLMGSFHRKFTTRMLDLEPFYCVNSCIIEN